MNCYYYIVVALRNDYLSVIDIGYHDALQIDIAC